MIQTKTYNLTFNAEFQKDFIVHWIQKYFAINGSESKAIIGLSGGKDSTIAAALLVEAIGADRVIGVSMPIDDNDSDAQLVAANLGIKLLKYPIKDILDNFYNTISKDVNISSSITTNTPARIRMSILYAIAADNHGRVVNTCNKSEEYVGYSTKYGDSAGDFSIFKNYTVREILQIGDLCSKIPYDLVHKTPDDGMCGKTDEENLGFTYETLDSYIIEGTIPEKTTYFKIQNAHMNNLHKNCIHLPAPENLKSHHLIKI